jgi:glycine cleavage system H protein
MSDTRYTEDHEWVRVDGEIATIGISNHAQEQLGDVVFVELPAVGRQVKQKDPMAVVESVKAASDVYAPLSGEVVAVNQALNDDPALVNSGAESSGWFCQLKLAAPGELDALLDAEAYRALVESAG